MIFPHGKVNLDCSDGECAPILSNKQWSWELCGLGGCVNVEK
jgi:hypothetical protein